MKVKSSVIPIHVVDDHNEALHFILRGIGSKKLSFHNNLLVHFDSHPDLLLSDNLQHEDILDMNLLKEKVSIETWILPLAYMQHVTEVVWVKPEWSNQIDNGTYTLYLGKNIDGNIRVSIPLFYFISAVIYSPIEELTDPRKLTLHVINWDTAGSQIPFCQSKVLQLIEEHNQNYLLDVDLDFFYTLNPFRDMYKAADMYNRLKVIYRFDNDELLHNSAQDAQEKRKCFLDAAETLFKTLNGDKDKVDDVLSNLEDIFANILVKDVIDVLKLLIKDLHKEYKDTIDWLMVHDAGTTIDDLRRELPHHPSTSLEINANLENMRLFLKGLSSPKLITVARSASDDYCPNEVADGIQENMYKIFRDFFGTKIEVNEHYLAD